MTPCLLKHFAKVLQANPAGVEKYFAHMTFKGLGGYFITCLVVGSSELVFKTHSNVKLIELGKRGRTFEDRLARHQMQK